jgi:hypothetical protein|tara:strand:+ start:163 stop:501 length:339 start_codon:yes stop_codon:yes gene_type:complete
MAINRTGFQQTNTGLVIDKDKEAQLIYTFDWSEWLESSDTIATSAYSVVARRNDPAAIVVESNGIDASNKKTYVEISGGASNKVYIVTADVTTANGLRDRRNFRINVTDRSA